MSGGPLPDDAEEPTAEEPETASEKKALPKEAALPKREAALPTEPTLTERWRQLRSCLSLFDFTRLPDSKAGWLVRIVVTAVAVLLLGRRVSAEVGPMLSARPPAPIPAVEIDDYRFRLPERMRREIFAEVAAAELAERQRAIAANTWKGHAWSTEDDRGHYERIAVRAAAAKHKLSLSQVYLVLDEGIRSKWPAPDGKPLPATTPPLNLRTNSW
jgi:hypothetical protein